MVDLSLDFSYEVILFLLLFCSLCITESYSLLTESPSLTLSTNATAEPNGSNTNIKPELFRQEDIKSQGALNDHFTQVLRAKAINPNLASLKSGEFMSFTPFDPSLQPSSQIVSKNNRIKLWIDNFGDNAANIRGFSFVYRNITLDCLLSETTVLFGCSLVCNDSFLADKFSFFHGKVINFPLAQVSAIYYNNSIIRGFINLDLERLYTFSAKKNDLPNFFESVITEDRFNIALQTKNLDESQPSKSSDSTLTDFIGKMLRETWKREHLHYLGNSDDPLLAGSIGTSNILKTPVTNEFRPLTPRKWDGQQKKVPQTKYIEMFIVNDYQRYLQYNRNLEDLELNTLAIISGAQNLFDRALFHGFKIKLILSYMFTETDYERFLPNYDVAVDASKLLEHFCDWKSIYLPHNVTAEGIPFRVWDNAHLLSGRAFRSNIYEREAETVEGLSYVRGMCTSSSSCSIVRAAFHTDPMNTALVLAHEIAHNLDAGHDGKGNECSPFGNVMQATSCSMCNQVAESWSKCSIDAIGQFLKSEESLCLDNSPNLCGNGILDQGEECDSGRPNGSSCCTETCRLRDGAQCDDVNGSCCFNCTLVGAGTPCNQQSGLNFLKTTCQLASFCDGKSVGCPINRKSNGSICHVTREGRSSVEINGVCLDGICRSRELLCEQLGLEYSKQCDIYQGCSVVCLEKGTSRQSAKNLPHLGPKNSNSSDIIDFDEGTSFFPVYKNFQGNCVAVSVQQLSGKSGPLSVPDFSPCKLSIKDLDATGICHAGLCSKGPVGSMSEVNSEDSDRGVTRFIIIPLIALYLLLL